MFGRECRVAAMEVCSGFGGHWTVTLALSVAAAAVTA